MVSKKLARATAVPSTFIVPRLSFANARQRAKWGSPVQPHFQAPEGWSLCQLAQLAFDCISTALGWFVRAMDIVAQRRLPLFTQSPDTNVSTDKSALGPGAFHIVLNPLQA